MGLFNPNKCSWCDTQLEQSSVQIQIRNQTAGEVVTDYCPNPACRWWDALPEFYEATPGWWAMNACWRV